MQSNNKLNFIECDKEIDESKTVIFGAPYDCTSSNKPGSRFAPNAIRLESFGLETYSPYQDKDLTDYKIADYGDLELSFGDPSPVLNKIENFTDTLFKNDKIPFMIGGEHLVSLAQIKSAFKKYPDMHLIHFDAHTDLRDDYIGQELSHATVIKKSWDFLGDGKIFQFGIRSGERCEFEWAKKHTYLNKYNFDNLDETLKNLKGKNVYFTLDLDILDPSVFSGTGTPEPGGVTFNELLHAILKFKDLNIIGIDVTELSPHYDQSGVSTAVACKIIRELLVLIQK